MQIQHIRHAIGDARHAPRDAHAVPAHPRVRAEQLVFAVHHADIHADLARQVALLRHLQARARVARVFDRHPRVLQKQTLLRIDVLGVSR